MKNKVKIFLLSFFAMIILVGCQFDQKVKPLTEIIPTIDETIPAVDLFADGIKSKFGFESVIKPTLPNDVISMESPNGDYVAVTFCQEFCELTIFQEGKDQAKTLKSSSFLPGRPFSNLEWISDQVLAFDQWVQPHYGLHYEVDIQGEKLLVVIPFNDGKP